MPPIRGTPRQATTIQRLPIQSNIGRLNARVRRIPIPTIHNNRQQFTCWHPISYCSKRTSKSEAKYELFLLEFAALKFCLDEFEPYIYGSPLEIETDCQALRDCLLQENMSVHHSRWKESILAHNIIAIRHQPGVENPVADGLSRMWDGHSGWVGLVSTTKLGGNEGHCEQCSHYKLRTPSHPSS